MDPPRRSGAPLPGGIEVKSNGGLLPLEKISGYEQPQQVRPGPGAGAQGSSAKATFKFDLIYTKKQFLSLDLKLIAVSFWISFQGKRKTLARRF